MRLNEYEKLEDFVNEYDGKREKGEEFHMGIEFKYKKVMYRMCREPIGQFYLYRINDSLTDEAPCQDYDYDTIGVYDTIEDLLSATAINNIPFYKVIMDDETLIDSKD